MNIEGRMRAIAGEIARLETEAQILTEQITFQSEVSEDARIRAVVSETPLADREASQAAGDLARLERSREEVRRRIEALHAERDRLLERMFEEKR